MKNLATLPPAKFRHGNLKAAKAASFSRSIQRHPFVIATADVFWNKLFSLSMWTVRFYRDSTVTSTSVLLNWTTII
jgi:hypothetical protein